MGLSGTRTAPFWAGVFVTDRIPATAQRVEATPSDAGLTAPADDRVVVPPPPPNWTHSGSTAEVAERAARLQAPLETCDEEPRPVQQETATKPRATQTPGTARRGRRVSPWLFQIVASASAMLTGALIVLLVHDLYPEVLDLRRPAPPSQMQKPVAAAGRISASRALEPTMAAGWRLAEPPAAAGGAAATAGSFASTDAELPATARFTAPAGRAPARPVGARPDRTAAPVNPPFDRKAAAEAIRAASARASTCGSTGRRETPRIGITFAPSGRATLAVIEGDNSLRGNAVGSCVARVMRSVRVPPFSGEHVTVHTSLLLH